MYASHARDLLLPACWAHTRNHPDIEIHPSLTLDDDGLIIMGVNKKHGWWLGFTITAEALQNDSYKEIFSRSAPKIVGLLSVPPS